MPNDKPTKPSANIHTRRSGRRNRSPAEVPIEIFQHSGQVRLNNPPVGLVDDKTDLDALPGKYEHDPHLDPELSWAGKIQRQNMLVPTVSLHVHERIDTRTVIESVRKTNTVDYEQISLFNQHENVALRDDIEFYKHSKNWCNRLVAGDSLLVMNSLLEKEGMSEKVQMVYFDPPYGIKYSSNFQPFTNKRDVKDADSDLNSEPETLRAFRDTWELGIHSYLTYLRDRLLLAQKMLHQSGSCFVQISSENIHLVRSLLDETFGANNFVSLITFATTSGFNAETLARRGDYLIWYAKDKKSLKYRRLYSEKNVSMETSTYRWLRLKDGTSRSVTAAEASGKVPLPDGARQYKPGDIQSQGETKSPQTFSHQGKTYVSGTGRHWKTSIDGMKRLAELGRIHVAKNSIQYVRYADDFPYQEITNFWTDTATGSFTDSKLYVVQTGSKVIERCILMTTDPGDLVIDPTCGSGTTAVACEKWGRRWITCDTSRIALTLAKQRVMTSTFDYYKLAAPSEGISSGLTYERAERVTLGSLANNEPAQIIPLYDRPLVDETKVRVAGPFTMEAVPAPTVSSLHDGPTQSPPEPTVEISRHGATARQQEWIDELLKTGARGKKKQVLEFTRLGTLSGGRWLHADGEIKNATHDRVVICFGPDHAPLDARHVGLALDEAQNLRPKPRLLIFLAFQFDPEAAKDIDNVQWPEVELLKVQMNPDLFTQDLKKKRSSSESFWLVGQPDVSVKAIRTGEFKGMHKVSVQGFDYFDVVKGQVVSGTNKDIAMWSLDTDYDSRSLFPRQVFFPMGGSASWDALAKVLRSEIDEELIEAYRGTVSIPFSAGENKQIAVKVVDNRGIESLRVIRLEDAV